MFHDLFAAGASAPPPEAPRLATFLRDWLVNTYRAVSRIEYAIIVAILVVIASVGSHMPGRFRHYSVWHRRVIHDGPGPDGKGGGEGGSSAAAG